MFITKETRDHPAGDLGVGTAISASGLKKWGNQGELKPTVDIVDGLYHRCRSRVRVLSQECQLGETLSRIRQQAFSWSNRTATEVSSGSTVLIWCIRAWMTHPLSVMHKTCLERSDLVEAFVQSFSKGGDLKAKGGDVEAKGGDVKVKGGDVEAKDGDLKAKCGNDSAQLHDFACPAQKVIVFAIGADDEGPKVLLRWRERRAWPEVEPYMILCRASQEEMVVSFDIL
ncbi:hypothetical protein [Absidia glauca]|uniref:Uncharacterized protein n=1 Tax=Absidia glauca TaxID=4829 RepID=A0A163KQV4_ABSGL|nr:hypothetical protein [Absidia glauca]